MSEQPIAVLHVALNPMTGPWSVMRELAAAQQASGRYAEVALGLVTDRTWPADVYNREIEEAGLRTFRTGMPHMFGTAAFAYQLLRRPGIEHWVEALSHGGTRRVVVHSHNGWMTSVYLPIRALPGRLQRVVATFHGVNCRFEGQPVRHSIHKWMARRLARTDTCLTTVDAYNIPVAERVLGLPPERFTVVHNGVSDVGTSPRPFMAGNGQFTIGHVGSLIPQKGWKMAVEAVMALRASGRDVRILIAGSGPDGPEVEAAAAANPEAVTHLGFVSDARGAAMSDMDLLAVMSIREGLPMSIIEAMSIGLPVAATAVGGIPEAVKDGESGVFVERSADALAEVIKRLMDNPAELERLAKGARNAYRNGFDIDTILNSYHRLYMDEAT